jgi:hypothetical protein
MTSKKDNDDEYNTRNDIALQKLLRESHLLKHEDLVLTASGKSRHKATDIHLQSLGSNKSIMVQEKMPMAHRKGIAAKAMEREEKRRKDARENGIILESAVTFDKPKSKSKLKKRTRDRGVGAPAVGRFSGGTLRLSSRDLKNIAGDNIHTRRRV